MITPIMPVYGPSEIAFERGEGVYLYDQDGKQYLDFATGIAATALGHVHPRMREALTDQAGRIWHTSNGYRIPGQERLAERLADATFADTMFFTNSGTEAVECAIKTARKHFSVDGVEPRTEILTFQGAFHGRTYAALSAAANPKYLEGFGDPLPGFTSLPFADHDALKAAMGPHICAVMVEPIQGEGGIRAVPGDCLRGLRELCDQHGALLIFDEVQTGMGRTGSLFAYEQSGVEPDILAAAKGLGSGFPLGACLATEHAARGMTRGAHGSTLGGNPLAMAVGNAVLDVMLEDGFFDQVNETANVLAQGLAQLVDSHPAVVSGIRGVGMLRGLKCEASNLKLRAACLAEGLTTVPAGDNVLRLLPALILTPDQAREGLAKLDAACKAVAAEIE